MWHIHCGKDLILVPDHILMNSAQVFQVPGVGLMAAMAHRSALSGSAVYIWNHTSFQIYQNISTYGALAWRHFIMGKKVWRKREMWCRNWAEACTLLVYISWIVSVFGFFDLDVSSGVKLWRRARQALQERKADGFLCDLQVESKTKTVCTGPDLANLLCTRLGSL